MGTMLDTEREPVLNKTDRCDRCGAAAMVRITTKDLGVWLWCGHHADKLKTNLPGIIHIHDERQPITVKPEGGTA